MYVLEYKFTSRVVTFQKLIAQKSDQISQCHLRRVDLIPRDRAESNCRSLDISAQTHFTLAICELIVFTTIPSSINLSAIIAQTLDSSPTPLHFIVPRSIFKRRRPSRRVCFDTVCVCICMYIHYALDMYLFYRNTLLNPFRAA